MTSTLRDVALSPDHRAFAFATTRGLWVAAFDGGRSRLLTNPSGIVRCAWHPGGSRLVAQVDPSGHEDYRLVEIDAHTGKVTTLCAADGVRHELGTPYGSGTQPYAPDGRRLAYSSNARDRAAFDVLVRDLASGHDELVFAADDRHYPVAWSPHGDQLLLIRVHQNLDHALFAHRFADGALRRVAPGRGPARCVPAGWSSDGRGIYLATDEGRDKLALAHIDLESGELRWIDTPEAEVETAAISPDGDRVVWCTNHDGYSRLWVLQAKGRRRRLRSLPDGVMGRRFGARGQALRFLRDGRRLLVTVATPTRPAEVYLLDVDEDRARQLTDLGADVPSGAVVPRVVRCPAHDGGSPPVPGLLYRPARASARERAPVVVDIHGGPEVQALPVYDSLRQQLLRRGIGVLAPNIRGSSGYGAAYQRLIYRDWGGGDLDDLARAVELLHGLDWVDARRIGVVGASYGGFAALSCLTRLPHLWRCGVAMCANSDLVARSLTGPPYWRRRLRGWVGDPDDPSDRQRLIERSPITHASGLVVPTLVIHGARDARVAPEQSDRFVTRLCELGKPVEYLRIPNAGHDLTAGPHRARVDDAIVEWFTRHLEAS